MLTAIPPWTSISPLDFTGVAARGAALGLQQAAQTQAADEAAERLRLGYAQLAAENARAGMAAGVSERNEAAANALRAMGLQAHIDENNQLNQFRAGELADRAADNALAQKKFDAAAQSNADLLKETSSLFGDLSKATSPADQLKVLSKYPSAAHALKAGILNDFVQKPETPPASVKLVDEFQKTTDAYNKALSAGDTLEAQKQKDRADLLLKEINGQQMSIRQDDKGGLIVQMGKGANGATVATESQAQQKLLKYENTLELMNHLDKNLQSGHVGFAGVLGENVIDKAAQQLAEWTGSKDVINKGRVDSRAALVALREGLLREMSNDPRFSNMDREEISKALPSSGVMESLADTRQRIDTVRNILMQRARTYSKGIGQEPPLWTLTADEIKTLFNTGKIDQETAINILTRFH